MKGLSALLAITCFCVLLVRATTANSEPVVKIKSGTLVGTLQKSRNGREYASFRGIPYALPPIGELRFQPPKPAASWTGIKSAKEDAEVCIQSNIDIHSDEVDGVEDCLYLNVYIPKLPASDSDVDNPAPLLPVLFWIHGGGWLSGSGDSVSYSGKFFLDHDVVLVAPNYRLAQLGFLSTEDLAAPGNLGLKDQTLALRWVQENIAAFGGDPNSVTIFGESAGGVSVSYHMLSPLSRGLFHRGISQSGTVLVPWGLARPGLSRKRAQRVAHLLGCPEDDSNKLIECLRTKDAADIIKTDRVFMEFGFCPMIPFRPVIEPLHPGAFIAEDPAISLKAGRSADVPWMVGFTSHEGAIKASEIYGLDNGALLKRFNDEFEKLLPVSGMYDHYTSEEVRLEVTKRIREFYLGDKPIDVSAKFDLVNLYSDAWFNFAIDKSVRDYLDAAVGGPIYYYHFAYQGEASYSTIFGDPVNDYGVSHADDLQYLFPVGEQFFKDKPLGEESFKVVDILTSLWVNFATTGNPTPEVTPIVPVEWSPVRTHDLEYLHIGGSKDLYMARNLTPERRQFWANLPFQPQSYIDVDRENDEHQSKDEL